jgi:hypothetical protein
LLPVAAASLLLPLAVCAVIGAQASLPKGRRRWWSRPLVALLYFLQPVVRGWERYQGRLSLHRETATARETLDSVTLRDSPVSLNEVRYWSTRRLDRVEFVTRIIRELDQRGWPNRSDIGWSEFDVEVYGNRWSAVQLITVAEDHPGKRQLIRCRLRARWSLHATVVFWLVVALETIVVGYFGGWLSWIALLLLTLPLFAYYLHRQKRNQQSLLIVFLDGLAKELGLLRIPSDSEAQRPAQKPAAAPVEPPEDSPFRTRGDTQAPKDPNTPIPENPARQIG